MRSDPSISTTISFHCLSIKKTSFVKLSFCWLAARCERQQPSFWQRYQRYHPKAHFYPFKNLPPCLNIIFSDSGHQRTPILSCLLPAILSSSLSHHLTSSNTLSPIPEICHFFYTHTFWGLKILHSKVRKFPTKKASRQNSVNLWHKLPRDKIA